MNSPPQDSIVTLGKIIGVFGVQGWIKVFSYTAEQDNILRYKPWYLYRNDAWGPVKLLSGKRQGKGLIARLEGIVDRDAALALHNVKIGALRASLPGLPDSEYYWSDLIGLQVMTTEGFELGQIDRLVETGANDVMVVKGDRERWLPWVITECVKSVDLVSGVVTVDWDPDF